MMEKKKYNREIIKWEREFNELRDCYGVPTNAAGYISSLMIAGQLKYGEVYTMSNAFSDYVKSMPQTSADFEYLMSKKYRIM